jgi:hypothetical protein
MRPAGSSPAIFAAIPVSPLTTRIRKTTMIIIITMIIRTALAAAPAVF